jgi:quinol monooxygenase YgiN
MQSFVRILLVFPLLTLSLTQTARAAEADVAYIVTYFEVNAADKDKAAALGRTLAAAGAKENGNLRFEFLQRIGYPDQFAILEAWSSKDAQAAHAKAAHTVEFRDKLAPMLRGAYDERPHTALGVGPVGTPAAKSKGAIFVVTHVDIIPPEKDKGVNATKEMADRSRSESGNIRYEALTQNSRPNHMTVVEIWDNQKSIEAHASQAHKKQYRTQLMPMSGSLYDERFYLLVN